MSFQQLGFDESFQFITTPAAHAAPAAPVSGPDDPASAAPCTGDEIINSLATPAPPQHPCNAATNKGGSTFGRTVDGAHVMVSTGTVTMHESKSLGSCEKVLDEVLILPPKLVSGTSSKCITAALLDNISCWAFPNLALDDVIFLFNGVNLLFVIFTSDSAAPNLKAIKDIAAYLLTRCPPHTIIVVWHGRCSLHLASRSINAVHSAFNLSMPVYGLSRILKMREYRKQLKAGIISAVKTLKWEPLRPPPEKRSTSASWRADILTLLLAQWGGVDADEFGGHSGVAVRDAVIKYFRFWNGDITDPIDCWHHCNGTGCHKTRADVVRDAEQVTSGSVGDALYQFHLQQCVLK
jgi:hypothetical protein